MRLQKWLTIALAVLTVGYIALAAPDIRWSNVAAHHAGGLSAVIGAVVFSAAGFGLSWTNSGADYSRYLPATTPMRRTWAYAFSGLVIGSTWMMILGAILASIAPNGGVLAAMQMILPAWLLWVVLITLTITSITHNSVNLYSCSMSSRAWDFPGSRTLVVFLAGAICCALAIVFGETSFEAHFDTFLTLMSYFMLPWLALRLLEFFWREPRTGARTEFFYRKDGPWRGVKWQGMIAFLVGIGVSVPFMSSSLYEGPVAHQLGGADISYFIGFIVTGLVYIAIARPSTSTAANAVRNGETAPVMSSESDGKPPEKGGIAG
jgi:NCS1 family nucleobase:cation symporter-1